MCLLIFASCDNEKVHLNENGQKTAIYQGKRLAESYSYHETKPDILAKNTVYNEDQSVVTKNAATMLFIACKPKANSVPSSIKVVIP